VQIKENEMDGRCSKRGRDEKFIRILVGTSKLIIPLLRDRPRSEINIKIYIKVIEYTNEGWIHPD
jgi:hypothetical protein